MAYQQKYWEKSNHKKRRTPTNPVIKAYVLPKIKQTLEYLKLKKGAKLLEIGCGNGYFTYHWNKILDSTGVDYSETMIKLNPVKKTYVMDANNLKIREDAFDIVFCHAVLHHVDNIKKVISEMKRVSSKYVVIMEPNRNNLPMLAFAILKKEERKAIKFERNFLIKNARSQGLKIVKVFETGLIYPNYTPKFLLPLFNLFNFKNPFGTTTILICKK